MADHKHGEMDISAQEKTFNTFVSLVAKAVIAVIVVLIFLALVNG
ncbi:aa3-type cytochrome c oxidase subunit IV [Yoonia sp.]|nr:aa3-type cytochrome c oxidase subunit IV [Yoonia sp.]MBE0412392.1 aa3-type cytochrome c oxidase subunit IV [Yoonia sp.]